MVGGALLRAPTSFSSCLRSSGASRVALTGPNFDVRPGGAIGITPADLLDGISQSGRLSTALADAASILLSSSLLGCLGPSSHCLPQLRGLHHKVHGRQGLRRRVRRTACPGLESLGRGKLHRILGDGPGAGNRGTQVKDNRIEKSTKHATKTKPKLLTQIEHSCSASSWRFFKPESPSHPSKTAPRAPPSCRPGGSRLPARTTPRPPQRLVATDQHLGRGRLLTGCRRRWLPLCTLRGWAR